MKGYGKVFAVLLCPALLLACDPEESTLDTCELSDACAALSEWPGLEAGQVRYEAGAGYRFDGIGGKRIYRRPDSNVEGGFRFFDGETDTEILMQAPASVNLGHTVTGQYDFRLQASLLDSTSYEPFSPFDFGDFFPPIPDLLGEFLAPFQVSGDGWGAPSRAIPFLPASGLAAGDALGLEDTVWASNGLDNDLHYMLVRQKIEIGSGGVLRQGEPFALEGVADRDVSIFVRGPSGDLQTVFEGNSSQEDVFQASINPYDVLVPGTNYLEIYASTGVASQPDRPPLLEDFESFVQGDAAADLEALGYLHLGSWQAANFDDSALGVLDPDAPSSNGTLLYQTGNEDAFVRLPDPAGLGFPDVTLDVTVGVPASDDDLVTVWVRHELEGPTAADQRGYYFFLRGPAGSGPAELGAAQAGLAMRAAGGTTTLLASDLDGPPLSTWVASHGMRNNTAEHWNLRIEAVGDRITVDISDRGTREAPAQAPTLRVVDQVDATFDRGGLALATESQAAWFDNLELLPIGLRAGLRIDVGETGDHGIQSLDTIAMTPRYYVEDNTLYDRMGDGTKDSNANPVMTSKESERYIDYVPGQSLALGPADELTCKCSKALVPTPVDISGDWTFTFTVLAVDGERCQGLLDEVHYESTTITHDTTTGVANLLGLFDDPLLTAIATVDGYSFSYTGLFPDGGGTTDRDLTMLINSDGTIMEGTEYWSWGTPDEPNICQNARSSVSAVRY